MPRPPWEPAWQPSPTIRVNAVAPDVVQTKFAGGRDAAIACAVAAAIDYGRCRIDGKC
ncbi:hypothetical protein [Nocardia veterana]|uniref:hypothetical protein n=1 Tax=Nocardia veterana TaxID=132249 RepID=UPI0014613E84|nr:hypothetical protein [Nocardia veterana]